MANDGVYNSKIDWWLGALVAVLFPGGLVSRYKYETIKSAEPSRNFLSSPALSLDRIKIEYDGKMGFFMISPADKEAFLQDLAGRAQHLEYANGLLAAC